jgi:hypothetical protein
MKKAFVVLFVAGAMATGLTSCKGDYTCSCTYEYIQGRDTTLVVPMNNVKKSDAEEACDLAQTTYQNADANASCTLD